jgi:hypothetical protein
MIANSTVWLMLLTFAGATLWGATGDLKRMAAPKPVYDALPEYLNSSVIILKLREGMGQPVFDGQQFLEDGEEWERLNAVIAPGSRGAGKVEKHFMISDGELNQMRAKASDRSSVTLPDLTLYYNVTLAADAAESEKLAFVRELNELEIIEIAYFPAHPELADKGAERTAGKATSTPNWQGNQRYLDPGPDGVNAYYAWGAPGGKGDNVKVVDIEGNWIQTHEDLHGGTDNFHIAGGKIADPGWWNHGTAVLGEIASDSNGFGMTGIAFNVDLGTVSIGTMSTANALITAANNSDTGDIILIELQVGGPNGGAYVPVEYYQAEFDAIVTVTAMGRIVVEAGANGAQDLDNALIYGSLFDPDYRFSGAIMVAASWDDHSPAPFTSHGQRLDVHAYGTWDVFTLGYGDLYGSGVNDYYTGGFSGTSSASPIIVGACACLQSINEEVHGYVMDHAEMRQLLQDFSTPQMPSSWLIGPMPELSGSVDQVVGVSFVADTTFGWAPVEVNFSGSSGLTVDTWTWDLGDGDSAFTQNPTHMYTTGGLYTVSLEIDAGGDLRRFERPNYVIALADSLIGSDTAGTKGTSVKVVVYGHNTVPTNRIKIPVLFSGAVNLTLDSFSTVGCRTDYFEVQNFLHYDASNKKVTVLLRSSDVGSSPDLPPGVGPLLNLHFKIPPTAADTAVTSIVLSGYDTRIPEFDGFGLVYQPLTVAGSVSVCPSRGSVDGVPGITVADITYLVAYLFQSGPVPIPLESANVDCTGGVNVADLTYLVAYLFQSGPAPCSC